MPDDPGQPHLALLRLDPTALDQTVEAGPEMAEPTVDCRRIGVVQQHGMAGVRGHERNAAAHGAGADHRDGGVRRQCMVSVGCRSTTRPSAARTP